MIERILIILLINILFYLKSLTFKYCSDDIPVLYASPKDLPRWKRVLKQIEGSIRVKPDQDHAITLAIHAITSVLVFTAFGASDISFIAALLFSVNPILNQGSIWISGRGYVLPTMFLLGALSFPFLSPILVGLATYYHLGVISPIALLGSTSPWMFLFLPIGLLFTGKRFLSGVQNKVKNEMFAEDKEIKPEKLILAIKTFGFYITNAIIPIKTTFYHSFLQSAAGNDIMRSRAYSFCRFFWLGCLYIGLMAWYVCFHKWDMVSFAILWTCVSLAPFSNLFRISQEIAERYAYMPTAGIMYIIAHILVGNPTIIALLMGVYMTKTWFWSDAFMDDYYLIEHSRLADPSAWFAWHVAAFKRWEAKSYQEALIFWVMAKNISPKEFKILFNIATVLKLAKNDKEANEYMELAKANIPRGQEEQAGKIIENWHKGNLAVLL